MLFGYHQQVFHQFENILMDDGVVIAMSVPFSIFYNKNVYDDMHINEQNLVCIFLAMAT